MNCVHGVRMDRDCMQCGKLNGPTTTEAYEAEVARLRERNREVTGALGTALRERDAARLEAGRLAEQVVELTGKLALAEVEGGRLKEALTTADDILCNYINESSEALQSKFLGELENVLGFALEPKEVAGG